MRLSSDNCHSHKFRERGQNLWKRLKYSYIGNTAYLVTGGCQNNCWVQVLVFFCSYLIQKFENRVVKKMSFDSAPSYENHLVYQFVWLVKKTDRFVQAYKKALYCIYMWSKFSSLHLKVIINSAVKIFLRSKVVVIAIDIFITKFT